MAKEKIEWKNVERYELRIPTDFFKEVDAWRRKQDDLPSRAEAIRRLVELGLKVKGNRPT
jgi:metal-responsive CopG/Arc/MetJ family transcriptional regulator